MRGGIHSNVAMAISGHETASVLKRYNMIDEERLVNASKKVDAFVELRSQALALDNVVHAEVVRRALPPVKLKRIRQLRVNCDPDD